MKRLLIVCAAVVAAYAALVGWHALELHRLTRGGGV